MNSNQPYAQRTAQRYVPVVDCDQVRAVMQHAQRLPSTERAELFADLERDPDVGPVVVAEVRSHLLHHPS